MLEYIRKFSPVFEKDMSSPKYAVFDPNEYLCNSRNIENVRITKTQRFESEKSAVWSREPLLNSDKIIKLHRAAQISVRGCLVLNKIILF